MREEPLASWLGVAVAVGAALFRAWLSWADHGIYWPDEIYQSLEMAHVWVFGHGLVPWEFVQGARTWALPGLVGGVMWLGAQAGGGDPSVYLGFVRASFIAAAAGTTWGVFRLARVMGARPAPAVAASFLFAFAAPFAYFGHRAMSETASALPVVFGLAFALESLQRPGRWRLWLGASLLGVAVLLRLQNGLFCLGLLAVFAARRDWPRVRTSFFVLAVWAAVFGGMDWASWGRPFHSALLYVQFNLIEGKASQWGTAPFGWYAEVLLRGLPVVAPVVALLAAASVRRAPVLLGTAVAFFLLHSLIPHKELRFLLPVVPLFCALAAVGLTALSSLSARAGRQVAQVGSALLVCAVVPSAVTAKALTFHQVGGYENQRSERSAWDDFGSVNRLLLRAARQDDVCGLAVEGVHPAWMGGYAYLHHRVPLYGSGGPPRGSRRFNYVITRAQDRSGMTVAQDGGLALVKLWEECLPDPGFSWRLP